MTFVDWKQIDTRSDNPNRNFLYLIIFVVVLVGSILAYKYWQKSYLKDSTETQGVITDISGGYHNFTTIDVRYVVNGDTLEETTISNACASRYKEGDKVTVVYSNEKPTFVDIKGCDD